MMNEVSYTAFVGVMRVAAGHPGAVALALKERGEADAERMPMVFDDTSGKQVDLDLRGSAEEILRRLPGGQATEEPARTGPGRPKLGVVAREVTLLPRHWEWLSGQPGGASVALRKLVEDARRANAGVDGVRMAREAAYRFMHAMAGDLPGYEDATRALFAGNREAFTGHIAAWPEDLRDYAVTLAAGAWAAEVSSSTAATIS